MKVLLILTTIIASSMALAQDRVFEASCESETVNYGRYDIYVEGGDRIVVMEYDSFGGKIAERDLALNSNYVRDGKNILKVYGNNGYTLIIDTNLSREINASFQVGNSKPIATHCEVE